MIISLDEAKKISDTVTQDALDGFEQMVRKVTNNHFQVYQARLYGLNFGAEGSVTYQPSNPKIKVYNEKVDEPLWQRAVSAPLDWFQITDTVEIGETGINDGLFTITEVSNNTLTLKGLNPILSGYFEKSYLTLVRYPADIKTGIIKLIQYDLAMGDKIGVKSQSVSRMSEVYYDISAMTNGEGYPPALLSFLDKYRKARI